MVNRGLISYTEEVILIGYIILDLGVFLRQDVFKMICNPA